MHPLITEQGRLSLYLLAWIPLAFLVAYLLMMTGGLAWLEAWSLALPLALLYALICLAPWYMCRALPLGSIASLQDSRQSIGRRRGRGSDVDRAGQRAGSWRSAVIYSPAQRTLQPAASAAIRHRRAAVPAVGGAALRAAVCGIVQGSRDPRAGGAHAGARIGNEGPEGANQSAFSVQQPELHQRAGHRGWAARAATCASSYRTFCALLSSWARSKAITLADELALARAYLEVEQVRFGARLRVEIDTDAACAQCVVPSLVLQPLVENAVKHGIAGLVDGGTIRLEAHCSDGRLQTQDRKRI